MTSSLFILIIILVIVIIGVISKVNLYESFLKGAKDGLNSSLNIYPTLFTFLLAITVLRYCGIIEYINSLSIFTRSFFPPELFIQVIIRPISYNSALTIMLDIYEVFGVDSNVGIISTFIQNSTDTTLYVISFYFASINISKTRYSVKAGLLIDVINILIALVISYIYLKIF